MFSLAGFPSLVSLNTEVNTSWELRGLWLLSYVSYEWAEGRSDKLPDLSLHISEMMWLGKGDLFYIPNIYLFYKSIKYSVYEREKECYTLVNKTWNKNEYTWKNTMRGWW